MHISEHASPKQNIEIYNSKRIHSWKLDCPQTFCGCVFVWKYRETHTPSFHLFLFLSDTHTQTCKGAREREREKEREKEREYISEVFV